MKLALSVEGQDLNAKIDPRFGRCKWFIMVDSGSLTYQVFENPALTSMQGAGIEAAEFVIDKGAEAVITGHVGPNALKILHNAGMQIYEGAGMTVKKAVEGFNQGRLTKISEAGQAHAGMKFKHGRS